MEQALYGDRVPVAALPWYLLEYCKLSMGDNYFVPLMDWETFLLGFNSLALTDKNGIYCLRKWLFSVFLSRLS